MYSYHNVIKRRIRSGELTDWEFVDDYPGIGRCLVLRFSTYPFVRPIRLYRVPEYAALLKDVETS